MCLLTAFAPYPKIKKKINEADDAPNPKIIFDEISIDLEKLPKKNTVSEYTCGFKKVKPKTYKVTYIGLYNEEQAVEGTAKQVINHILTLAL